jgi:hypothetical protein
LTRTDDGKIGIPGYPEHAAEFLDGSIAKAVPYTKSGYLRDWIGFAWPEEDYFLQKGDQCDPQSVLSYCYGSVATEPEFRAGTPRLLFEGPYELSNLHPHYDVSPDSRFIMLKTDEERSTFNVILNWLDELERLAPQN